jgi:hypothetical protein
MIYLKGDIVQLKSGRTGEIVDSWGIAIEWFKVKLEAQIITIKHEQIDSLIKRENKRKRGV